MSPQRLKEIMKNYRAKKARYAYLQESIADLEQTITKLRNSMVGDMISLSQAITGMPHGSGTSDPTGKLGIGIASGDVSEFVKQAEASLAAMKQEANMLQYEVRVVETVLEDLGDREQEVLILKIIDNNDWKETLSKVNEVHNNSYSKRTLQRLLDRALEKSYAIVR